MIQIFRTAQVPGLAENRPSVLRGDALYAVPADEAGCGREYEGFVHHVGLNTVRARRGPGRLDVAAAMA